ncbi:hypothetical protein M1O16_00820, partial [Dehalococcoidia bacterium]|nr:hypothetical protein [Dehalococcoidia bacterium]
GLTNLTELRLGGNQISHLTPLVANTGLGQGDEVDLRGNPLDLTPGSQNMRDIEELQGRGVIVSFAPTRVIVNITPQPDTVSELRDKINRQLQLPVKYPPYFRDPNSFISAVAVVWADFTSWITQTHLTERYDELYQAGIAYDGLRLNALIKARDSLDRNDVVTAEKYLQKSYTYGKLSAMSFRAASEVFLGNLEAGQILAEGIKKGSKASVKLGVSVINPKAAKALDYIYLGVNYAVDRALVGEEQAIKDAIVKTAVTTIFNKVKFEDLGGRTIADYTKNRIGKLTFPMLQKAFRNNEQLQFELSKIIKELGTDATEDLVFSIVNELENVVNWERSEVKSPVELRVYDSRGAVTGLLNGEVKHGISRSVYYNGTVTIFYPSDSYRYEVAGTGDGTYGLTVTFVADEVSTFTLTNVPISTRAVHQYTIDWDALAEGEEGVTMKIDSDGDGTFEEIKSLGREGIGFQWIWVALAALTGLLGVLAGALMVWRRMGRKHDAKT